MPTRKVAYWLCHNLWEIRESYLDLKPTLVRLDLRK